MDKKVLNYRIVIEPEKYEDGSTVYVAYCPTLGISDYGRTIEEVLDNVEKGIRFHLDCLIEEGEPVPEPDEMASALITYSSVPIPDAKFSFA